MRISVCFSTLLALSIALAACERDEKDVSRKSSEASPVVITSRENSKPKPTENTVLSVLPERRTNPEKSARAVSVLDFYNAAVKSLGSGYYSMPGKMLESGRRYARNWVEPQKMEIPSGLGEKKALTPTGGIFNEAEEVVLTKALDDMDKAFARIVGHYGELLNYTPDARIEDDDRKGKRIQADLEGAYAQFMRARQTYMGMLDEQARGAEEVLLKTHPLERQILCAREIFVQLRQIAEQLQSPEPLPSVLENFRKNLEELVNRAGLPPFPAEPAQERLFRRFLNLVSDYARILQRSEISGFTGARKRELGQLAEEIAGSYNEFAALANSRR